MSIVPLSEVELFIDQYAETYMEEMRKRYVAAREEYQRVMVNEYGQHSKKDQMIATIMWIEAQDYWQECCKISDAEKVNG